MSDTLVRTETLACVAFDVALGEQARQDGLVYDVNWKLLHESLLEGGLHEEDISTYPVVVMKSDNPTLEGATCYRNADEEPSNPLRAWIELHTYKGEGEITTSTVAHEAKHLADHLHVGESAFVSQRARVARKIAATLGIVGAGIGYYFIGARGGFALDTNNVIKGVGAFLESDVILSATLAAEYAVRKQERSARRAEKLVVKENILEVNNATSHITPVSRWTKIIATAGNLFLPDYSL